MVSYDLAGHPKAYTYNSQLLCLACQAVLYPFILLIDFFSTSLTFNRCRLLCKQKTVSDVVALCSRLCPIELTPVWCVPPRQPLGLSWWHGCLACCLLEEPVQNGVGTYSQPLRVTWLCPSILPLKALPLKGLCPSILPSRQGELGLPSPCQGWGIPCPVPVSYC